VSRLDDVIAFYAVLHTLERKLGGVRRLCECEGRMSWPRRGVYFFFEPGETRSTSGSGSRVVRVGSHALTERSRTTLWSRLRQHRGHLAGTAPGGGNHRGSVFRRHVGAAMMRRNGLRCPTWGVGESAPKDVRGAEANLERRVSAYIGAMPLLWLAVDGGPDDGRAMRHRLESNSIALLSNARRAGDEEPIDPASATWLGAFSAKPEVSKSGLWNVNHVDERYDPTFLADLVRRVRAV